MKILLIDKFGQNEVLETDGAVPRVGDKLFVNNVVNGVLWWPDLNAFGIGELKNAGIDVIVTYD